MPRFAANLTWLFTEHPLADRVRAAGRAGFDAVEVLFPYGQDLDALRQALDDTGLHMALINTPAPDWETGGRGCGAVPGREEEFRDGFSAALRTARRLGAGRIHVMSGRTDHPAWKATLIDNLRWAALEAADLHLTIEPLNARDMPGYALQTFSDALTVLEAVGAPNLGLQFDTYHAQHMGGDVAKAWAQVAGAVTHVQVAGFPDRAEPVSELFDHAAFFRRLDRDGYAGFVGAEYRPAGRTEEGLGWLASARSQTGDDT
ncbi:MAG: TIM barrel protein [Pseudomonadota bacterium]